MGKLLSPWCKSVKIEMIHRGMSITDLAVTIGRSREYTSAVVNGRVRAAPTEKEISDVLNVPYSEEPYPQEDYT
jgi:nitroimidazol reductase NimA-like FMN-containing flavoprotein (pyridoxamine 5'-phosphate oxidase superfamily)